MASEVQAPKKGNPMRKLPEQEPRIETGPIQFGDDWPGLFIRGDNAFYFAMSIQALVEDPNDPLAKRVALGLISELKSCIV